MTAFLPAELLLGDAVKQEDHPSQEQVDKIHKRFAMEIKKLFDDHKHLLGPQWAQKELQIV